MKKAEPWVPPFLFEVERLAVQLLDDGVRVDADFVAVAIAADHLR